jgi:MoxR-like ATPase
MIKILSTKVNVTVTQVGSNIMAKVVSPERDHFSDIRIGEHIIAKSNDNIYAIQISQTQSITTTGVEIEGQVYAKSHAYNKVENRYNGLFAGKNIKYLVLNNKEEEDNAMIDFLIVPSSSRIKENYKLTKAIQSSTVSKFNMTDISNRWDTIMNGDASRAKVIGHERIKDEVISSVISGKHILLYGPPGTGKTMLANRISHVFECDNKVFTAHAEWTADDTVGGYTFTVDKQSNEEKIEPTNGYITNVVLECNQKVSDKFYNNAEKYRGTWAVVDELNRAKMDFAFGALFTALDKDYSVLNLPQYKNYDDTKSEIYIPNTFRIIGTINNFDKNFLFKFSYALSRRFAHIYVGVPNETEFNDELLTIYESIRKYLINEFGVNAAVLTNLHNDDGIKVIADLVSYLRGYGADGIKIRDIGTALLIDSIRLYCVQKFVVTTGTIDANKQSDMVDIAVNSIIIPALEGVLDDPQIDKLTTKLLSLKRTVKSLNNYKNEDF